MRRTQVSLVAPATFIFAQSAHLPRSAATHVGNSEVQHTLAKTPGGAVTDQAIRVVSINDE
jgi:hypothetical protein